MKIFSRRTCLLGAVAAFTACAENTAPSQTVTLAVAANFAAAAQQIATAFTEANGGRVNLAIGSTGKLATQIAQGAPFDIFLAADAETPMRCVEQGYCAGEGALLYATGRLAMISAQANTALEKATLSKPFGRLVIANPEIAPYGQAAIETLRAIGAYDAVRTRIIYADSVAQAYRLVTSGAADLGFVAASQVQDQQDAARAWIVPETLHAPLQQVAVLTLLGQAKPAARAFMRFLSSLESKAIISENGYGLPASNE